MIDELSTRAATDADLPAILRLLRQSMGRAEDERFEALFRWKHLENPFGRSPMWIACDGDEIVGLRTLMRWEFERGRETFRSVRAVDTATHPDYQGRGIFTRLTLAALEDLEAEGIDFVFNTPNTQSLPGYLKMGWQEVGRAPACVRPLSVRGAFALVRNRVPASHWSEPVDVGEPVENTFDELLDASAPLDRLRTRRTREYLEWRFGTPLLRYRAVRTPNGVALVRVRRRGATREAVLALVAAHDLRAVRRALRPHADHLIGVGKVPGCVRVRAFGPIVTTRAVRLDAPRKVDDFDFSMGDVELF
jgi:GNAT superfamily N-acetyltransferase